MLEPFSDSTYKLSEESRRELQDELDRKIKALPHIDVSQHYGDMPVVPTDIRLGDNPLFDALKKTRDAKKLD